MTSIPETRESLLLRIRDHADAAAWAEFSAIYQPVIYRIARKRGLQHADAQDLVQQVLASVADVIEEWQPDAARARFRTWLTRVARNAVIDSLRRSRRDHGRGGSSAMVNLSEQAFVDDEVRGQIDHEYRRSIFREAARQIRDEFEPATWDAFWLSVVEGVAVEETASRVGRSVGSVYAARSRVMRRLKAKVRTMQEEANDD